MDQSKILKKATNEWTLLSWRAGVAFLSSCVAIMSSLALVWLADIRSSQSSLAQRFVDFQLVNEARLGRVEGELGQVKSSAVVHRDRLINVETDVRTLWQRLYDSRTPQSQKGTP